MGWALLAGLFLPLFPLSMVFNAALKRLRSPSVRFVLLMVWPQLGVLIVTFAGVTIPEAWVPWAIFTAGLYAIRMLTVCDLAHWAGFLATSSLALVWVMAPGTDPLSLHLFALAFSLPSALLSWLADPLVRRFGAAYAGLNGGLAEPMPRWSGALALSTLAAIATPPFPGFFGLLKALSRTDFYGVVSVLAIWLIWGWAATRLWQGFIFGAATRSSVDIERSTVMLLVTVLVLFMAFGLFGLGGRW